MSTNDPNEEMRVLEAAYELAVKARSSSEPLRHAEAKEKLQAIFPALSFDEISEAYYRAASLEENALYDMRADRFVTDAEALASFKERFPGFRTQIYA